MIYNANKIRIQRDTFGYNQGLSVLLFRVDGVKQYRGEISWVEHEPYTEVREAINLNGSMAQELMDDLWQCGVRPSEGTGSAGSLKATQDHLKDMQRLVFKNK